MLNQDQARKKDCSCWFFDELPKLTILFKYFYLANETIMVRDEVLLKSVSPPYCSLTHSLDIEDFQDKVDLKGCSFGGRVEIADEKAPLFQ